MVLHKKVGESEQNFCNVRDLTEEGLKQVQDQKERLGRMHGFIENMPDSSHYIPSPDIHEYMDIWSNLMGSFVQLVDKVIKSASENNGISPKTSPRTIQSPQIQNL